MTGFALGGTEQHLVNLFHGLDHSRFEFELACMKRQGQLLEEFEKRHIPIGEYPVRHLYGPGTMRQQFRFARELTTSKIAIVHSYNFYANVFAVPAARLARTPVVLASIRDIGAYLTPRQQAVQRQVCRLADGVLVNAEAIRRWLVQDGYDDSKISVIHNGLDLSRFETRPATPPLRYQLSVPDGAPLVALLARIDPVKRVEDFLEAAALVAARFSAARFIVVGDEIVTEKAAQTAGQYRQRMETLANRLGLSGRVFFTGVRLDVPHVLAEVTVSVLPSTSEGLSNTILESMAARIPVVATAVGGTPELVDDGVTGLLVPPRNPATLAAAIVRLLENPELARRFGNAAHDKVAQRFSLERMARDTERVYMRLLEARQRRSPSHDETNRSRAALPRSASGQWAALERPPGDGPADRTPPRASGVNFGRFPAGESDSSLRAHVKSNLARALSATAGSRLIGNLTGVSGLPLVVGYHRVVERRAVETPTIPQMLVTPPMFERQLDWIGQRYTFVSLDELARRLDSGQGRAEQLATITFDDGYADIYENAFPVLMRKGIPAAVFLVTDWIGEATLLIHDRLHSLLARGWPRSVQLLIRQGLVGAECRRRAGPFEVLRRLLTSHPQGKLVSLCGVLEEELGLREEIPPSLKPLSWEMLATMHRAGITVGSHTRSHPVLTQESAADVTAELTDSREALQRRLGSEIRCFAYPDGACDVNIVRAVAAAGYRLALTACHHSSRSYPLLTIPRRMFWENTALDAEAQFSAAILSCYCEGVFDLVAENCQTHPRLH